jgi:colicin import membrane protein
MAPEPLPAPQAAPREIPAGESLPPPTLPAAPSARSPHLPAGESVPKPAFPTQSAPASGPARRRKRVYKRHKPLRVTKAQRAAASAKLAKAREALRARGWPHSERQRAAARKNIKKAQQAIRRHGVASTEARRTSALANLAKANAALRAQGYPRNEKQIAAARRNLLKAWEVSHARDPVSYVLCHAHKFRHGLYADVYDALMMKYLWGFDEPLETAGAAQRARRARRLERQRSMSA